MKAIVLIQSVSISTLFLMLFLKSILKVLACLSFQCLACPIVYFRFDQQVLLTTERKNLSIEKQLAILFGFHENIHVSNCILRCFPEQLIYNYISCFTVCCYVRLLV